MLGEATNEPNIAMDPRNFLAVRSGAQVPADQARRFDATLLAADAVTRAQLENSTRGGLA